MKDGFIKVSAITPVIKVADVESNVSNIIKAIDKEYKKHTKISIFPELCITGYTCGDLFLQKELQVSAIKGLDTIISHTKGHDMLTFVGLPYEYNGKLYNAVAAIQDGHLLGLITKTYIPNYNEFYEVRHFAKGPIETIDVLYHQDIIPMGSNIIFECFDMPGLRVAGEICEDLWVMAPPSTYHAMAGATVIINASASNELVGKNIYRRDLILNQSARTISAYIYASSGDGESTQDVVFTGRNMIADNGKLVAQSGDETSGAVTAVIDIQKLISDRIRMTTYESDIKSSEYDYTTIEFRLKKEITDPIPCYNPNPFIPIDEDDKLEACKEVITIQSLGLKKRLEHIGTKDIVIGLSGGLDSTLALLICIEAFKKLSLSAKGIHAITMPCFGTTDRTYNNAISLAKVAGTSLETIDIQKSVLQHFADIGQEQSKHDVTYENAQARERTQVLMDIANKVGGIVIGTGDLSELALGWATYNGDHMSMYAVNSSVPKTLIRDLIRYYISTSSDKKLISILKDVLDTPVSPELLPPTRGKISQKTEDIVGPYELHDYFLYYMLRYGFKPSKIYRLASISFAGRYDSKTIIKWMEIFYKRFFSQQFKRSCMPDGPKVGSIALSPRGDLRMPSDAVSKLWLDDIKSIKSNKNPQKRARS